MQNSKLMNNMVSQNTINSRHQH